MPPTTHGVPCEADMHRRRSQACQIVRVCDGACIPSASSAQHPLLLGCAFFASERQDSRRVHSIILRGGTDEHCRRL